MQFYPIHPFTHPGENLNLTHSSSLWRIDGTGKGKCGVSGGEKKSVPRILQTRGAARESAPLERRTPEERETKSSIRKEHIRERTKHDSPAFFEKSRGRTGQSRRTRWKSKNTNRSISRRLKEGPREQRETDSRRNQEPSSTHVSASSMRPPSPRKETKPKRRDPDLLLHDADANGDPVGAHIPLRRHHCRRRVLRPRRVHANPGGFHGL